MKTLLALPFIALPLVALSATLPALVLIAATPAMAATPGLGDLTMFEKIASDTLMLVEKGDLPAAKKRITDFETAWDKAQPRLYHLDKTEWGVVDDAADKAISSLRSAKPNATEAKTSVSGLIAAIKHPSTP
ncbi:hypothetical protein RMR10_005985 [Agrobacterium rosae]|uniref:hypothetical protein n=1 Tax=Agrobacterium rosae TaxID=1972867 RepID=UPI002A17904D|nr:hypothetical protein [Agrobacterium rosae]MDX8316357.1 hypothetical protein [Agrobacterium rosae]